MFKQARLILLVGVVWLGLGEGLFAESTEIRVGHFPNVTHAPALIAQAKKHFENSFGKEAKIAWKIFNAGPEAIEALFAGAIDILYVGPNPAVNGYVRSKGEALRIVAGAASGGSAFVVRQDSRIERFEDIQGKRVASPQKGNTQDVALLHLMREKGLFPRTKGGDVEIFNIAGGDQITAFVRKQVDAIWTVEPWVSRLVSEANGKILFEENELWPEGKYATTVLVVRKKFMDEHKDLVVKWVKGHKEITDWINQNYTEAKRIFNEELSRETGKALPPTYLEHSFSRITFTYDPMESSVLESAKRASEIGYLGRNRIALSGLYDLSFLEEN
ncbi:MAG: ABC transporter substrate-binding protein [Candidatus Omnitrophica bacterium]|nr:ABC transporter substrate-binding protein [Candidatus Omnitrophota bacterium]